MYLGASVDRRDYVSMMQHHYTIDEDDEYAPP